MITGMDRLRAAAQGSPCDRIPVFCNLLDQGAREMGVSLRDYYNSADLVAEAQLRMRARYGYDNVWSLFYVGKEAELLGCRDILYAEDGPPNVADFIIKDPADIHRLRVPDDLFGHPQFAPVRRCIELLRAEIGGRVPICAYITASMALPALLMGMEKWMELLLLGPTDLRDELLAKCSEFCAKEIAAYRAAGADVLVYSNPFGSTDIVSRRMFDELSLPWMRRDLKTGGVADMVYYCGGARMNRVIDGVIRALDFRSFYLSPLEDVAEGVRQVAGRGLVCGIIDDIKLVRWSEEEIRAEVARIVNAGKTGGRFLFGTLLMPLALPERTVRTMLEAAFEYGRLEAGAAP